MRVSGFVLPGHVGLNKPREVVVRDAKAEAGVDRRNSRIGAWLEAIMEGRGAEGLPEGTVTGISIRMPTEADPATLLIVRATGGTGKHIAFVGAYSVNDALLAWAAKCRKAGMKWREDVPWGER